MLISPANYKKQISASVIKEAKQLLLQKAVRELDEVETGKFVAYVDEGDASYDVMLQLNAKRQVQGHQCDCGQEYFFCAHQAAVYLHLLEHGTAAQKTNKVRRSKKTLESEAFFEDLSYDQIKQWLWQFFEKDKTAKLQFMQALKPGNRQYTPAEIRENTLNISQAVLGRKRKADAAQVKKMAELWDNFHRPIVQEYLSDVNRMEVWDGLYQLVNACREVNFRLVSNSRRIDSYLILLKADLLNALLNVADEKEWLEISELLVPLCGRSTDYSAASHFFLELILDLVGRKPGTLAAHFCKALMELHAVGKLPPRGSYYSLDYRLFKAFAQNDAISPYLENFQTQYGENEYNLDLIRLLTKKGFLERAILCCEQCIERNHVGEYNLPFYNELEKLYGLMGNQLAVIQTCMKVVEVTYDFRKFNEIIRHEAKYPAVVRWKNKWVQMAMNRSNYSVEAQSFCIAYCIQEADDKKLDSYIREGTSLALILHYFSEFFRVNKDKLLQMLMTRSYRKWGIHMDGSDSIQELIPVLRSHYTDTELQDAENKLKNPFASRSYELPTALKHLLHPASPKSKGKK